jgi:23S rRNA pseudouridine2604 synthase
MSSTSSLMRLSKLMAQKGLCSRREADEFIERGWVRVNGEILNQLGSKVSEDALVELEPQALRRTSQLITVLLNKPVGYVSTQPEHNYPEALDLITNENRDPQFKGWPLRPEQRRRLSAAGRLDIDSSGLLVLTQSGVVAKTIIGEQSEIEKEYLVRVQGQLSAGGIELLRHGLSLDGVKLKPAKVEWLNEDQLQFILREGRKRQIRRMCEQVELEVTGLKRVRIGNVKLGPLQVGHWRYLRDDESF